TRSPPPSTSSLFPYTTLFRSYHRPDNPYHPPGDPDHPHVLTTYRLTEHHSGGTPTRSAPLTAELQPEGFAELPPQLAAELGVQRSEEHTSELQSRENLVCRLL